MSSVFYRQVSYGRTSYPYFAAGDHEFPAVLSRGLQEVDPDRVVVVTEPGIPDCITQPVVRTVGENWPVAVVEFGGGEANKTLRTIEQLARSALEAGTTRSTCLLALGGGVVGNTAGLLASLLFRGIALAHVPTTLMAMSDAVLSQKTAANTPDAKNVLGTYHAPRLVCTNLSYLDSLPNQEIRAALFETIKNTLAIQPDFYSPLQSILVKPRLEESDFLTVLDASISAKLRVMANDERERGDALVLEYGHTAGHALEFYDRSLSHGMAVGFGLRVAARVAARLGVSDLVAEHESLLAANQLPDSIPFEVDPTRLRSLLRLDNKRGYRRLRPDETGMVLLQALGAPRSEEGAVVTAVPTDLLCEAIVADARTTRSALLPSRQVQGRA